MSPKPTTPKFLLPLILTCWIGIGSPAAAQEIRWNFSADDEFLVTQTQTSDIETLVEKRKSILGSSIELTGSWKVTSVKDDVASIDQTNKSIKINIDNPADNTKSVAINTASDTRPAKNSRELLKQLKPLVGMAFKLKMNTRGEVLSVNLPDETKKRLDEIPADSLLKALLDPRKLQSQIQSTSLTLPKSAPEKGQSVVIEPATGSATQTADPLGERKMTYVGQKNIDGTQLDLFSLSTSEKADPDKGSSATETATASQPNVDSFDWNGELQFDRDSGHCVQCQQQTKIKTSRSYRDMEMSTEVIVESVFKLQRK